MTVLSLDGASPLSLHQHHHHLHNDADTRLVLVSSSSSSSASSSLQYCSGEYDDDEGPSLTRDGSPVFLPLQHILYLPTAASHRPPPDGACRKLPLALRLDSSRPFSLRPLTLPTTRGESGDTGGMSSEPAPESPPELSSSRSSAKSSSLHSSRHSQDEVDDASHFEDISLADVPQHPVRTSSKRPLKPRPLLRTARTTGSSLGPRKHPSTPNLRDASNALRTAATLNSHARGLNAGGVSPRGTWPRSSPLSKPTLAIPERRNKSTSSPPLRSAPPFSSRRFIPHVRPDDTPSFPPRSGSLPASRRKSAKELEQEYHDSDEELPEDVVVWNIPLSPRPKHKRSDSGSPEPNSPPAAAPVRFRATRTKSWNDVLSDLSDEAQKLTAALELHSDVAGQLDLPVRTSSLSPTETPPFLKRRSSTFELPPVQKSNIMVDPLPISKEKEKHLTRTRPSWLPPKCPKEERRHLREYQRIMESYMESERRKSASGFKAKAEQAREADALARTWEQQVLPDWANAIKQPHIRELWWRGIPSVLRGRVWSRAIGNDLRLSAASYDAASARATAAAQDQDRDPARADSLLADVSTALPSARLFQPGQTYHAPLVAVLAAYAAYRSDAGHVRGTASIAALLLLHLNSEADTFVALANLLNRPASLAFCLGDAPGKERVYRLVARAARYKLPQLAAHLEREPGLVPEDWLAPMAQSLFTAAPRWLTLEHVSRLWDVLLFEGEAGLVRAAVGVLASCEARLYGDRDDVLRSLGWPSPPRDATAKRASGASGSSGSGALSPRASTSPSASPCQSNRSSVATASAGAGDRSSTASAASSASAPSAPESVASLASLHAPLRAGRASADALVADVRWAGRDDGSPLQSPTAAVGVGVDVANGTSKEEGSAPDANASASASAQKEKEERERQREREREKKGFSVSVSAR